MNVGGVPPQSFREDSFVNERVQTPVCRYAELVQICRTDGYYANAAKAYKKIAFLFTVRMFKSTVKRKAIVKPFDLFNYLSMFTDNCCQSYCRMEL